MYLMSSSVYGVSRGTGAGAPGVTVSASLHRASEPFDVGCCGC